VCVCVCGGGAHREGHEKRNTVKSSSWPLRDSLIGLQLQARNTEMQTDADNKARDVAPAASPHVHGAADEGEAAESPRG